MKQHLFHLLEIEVSVHPIQDATAENERYANLEYVVSSFFHDMISSFIGKGNLNSGKYKIISVLIFRKVTIIPRKKSEGLRK
jgi:hypothetical protein